MKELKGYIKELLSLINTTELSAEQINRMKDLVCFLSEKKACSATEEEKKRLEYILYSASVRMRTFGYNRLNSFSAEKINTDVISQIKDDCVADYYKTETGYVLDKKQKAVLDYFEQHQGRLFLSAPTSFGKTFLLQEIIYRNYDSFDNIVIVLPTVALLMEVTDDLSSFCKKNSLEYTFVNSVYRDLEIGEKNIFILTPCDEKFSSYSVMILPSQSTGSACRSLVHTRSFQSAASTSSKEKSNRSTLSVLNSIQLSAFRN